MSLWDRIQYLSSNSKFLVLNKYSSTDFPLEVREFLALWIENNILKGDDLYLTPGNPEHEIRIAQLTTALINEVKSVADSYVSYTNLTPQKLRSAYLRFRELPLPEVYRRLTDCLKEELRLVQLEQGNVRDVNENAAGRSGVQNGQPNAAFVDMSRRVCTIVNQRNEWASVIDSMETSQEDLMCRYQHRATTLDLQRLSQQQVGGNGTVNDTVQSLQLRLNRLDQEIQAQILRLKNHEFQCIAFAEGMVSELEELVKKLISEFLVKFKWSEYSVDEKPVSLDDVQRWYVELLETISHIGQILQQRESATDASDLHSAQFSQEQSIRERIHKLKDRLDSLYTSMMSNCLLVDEQPPQVIKKDSKVLRNNENVSVRFLCGEKFLTLASPPVVKVAVLNVREASALHASNRPTAGNYQGCGRVINGTGTKLCDPRSSRLIHQFRNLSVASVRRVHKKNEKRAMTEKFAFLFFTEFKLNGKPYELWCCSVPFVFIVHVCQRSEAWATIFWDNAFRLPNRDPFVVPEEVPWSKMAPALKSFFKSHTETTWDLTPMNVNYLGEKIFGKEHFSDSCFVSFKEITAKEVLPKLGFWEWFFATLEVTQKHLAPYWDNGFIVGFINRCRDAEIKILSKESAGTLMVRFSDSTLGGISICYIHSEINNGVVENYVDSLKPFTESDLKIRRLGDRLNDVAKYICVYHYVKTKDGPKAQVTPKAIAFRPQGGSSSSPRSSNAVIGGIPSVRRPYVSSEVIMVISSDGASSGSSQSNANSISNVHQSRPKKSTSPEVRNIEFKYTIPERPHILSRSPSDSPSLFEQVLREQSMRFTSFTDPQQSRRNEHVESQASPQQQVPGSPLSIFDDIEDAGMLPLTDEDRQTIDFILALESLGNLSSMDVEDEEMPFGSPAGSEASGYSTRM